MTEPSPPQGRSYACPVCADTFQSAWYRDEHFDTFHIVVDKTLLPHDTPNAASPPSARAATVVSRSPEREKKPSTPELDARIVGQKHKRASVYRYIYYHSRREKGWIAKINCRGRRFTSSYQPTEEDALQAYATEMERRGDPARVPPLRDVSSAGSDSE